MNFFKSLLSWASSAWHGLAGIPADVSGALQNVWHYITSVHDLFTWVASNPALDLFKGLADFAYTIAHGYEDLFLAVARVGQWIFSHWIMPWVRYLQRQIAALAAKEARDVKMLIADDIEDLLISEAYTEKLTGIERAARIKDVAAARAYALQLTQALHQAIEAEAASGYTSGQHDRLATITSIFDDLATRNPVVRALVGTLVKDALDLIGVENPLARIAISLLLKEVINKLGVDAAAGQLAARLLGAVTGEGHPKNLHDVIAALDRRLTGVEDQWADFMKAGGPEVEQAGAEWKELTSLTVDAALLGTFGLAVVDPSAWATGIADTIGAATNAGVAAVADLLRHV